MNIRPKGTKEQLQAEVTRLAAEVESLRRASRPRASDTDRQLMETLHNLQVHQEELRAQNEELRQAQENMERIGAKYRDLFEYSPVGYFILDEHLVIQDANIAAAGILGRSKGRLTGKPFLLFVEKESRPLLDTHFQAVKVSRHASSELSLLPDDGPSVPVILETVSMDGDGERSWRCLVIAQDISGRKAAEAALQDSEMRFRAIFEQSPLAMRIVKGADGQSMSNRAWTKLWGNDGDRDATAWRRLLSAETRSLDGTESQPVEMPAIRIDPGSGHDRERWVHAYVYPILGTGSKVSEVVQIHEDISARHRAEVALEERTERLRRQYENLRVLGEIAALRPEGDEHRLSEALELGRRHLGLAHGTLNRIDGTRVTVLASVRRDAPPLAGGTIMDVDDTPCSVVMESDDVAAISHMALSPYRDHPSRARYRMESYIAAPVRVRGKAFGTIHFAAPEPFPRDFDEGDREFVRLLARWVGTVLEEAEIRRDLAQSNAELEQFAYVASHDLRQPLRQIAGFISLLQRRHGHLLDGEAREFISFAHDGAERMDRLIVDLLEFARVGRNEMVVENVDLGPTVEMAVANLRSVVRDTGATIHIPADLPAVTGHQGDLIRLFQNLIGNAIKYCPAGRAPEVSISAIPGPSRHVVTIKDNGIGIAPVYFETIFGVFKRLHTSDKYEGTGIGLAICKKVVEQHNGRIWVDSHENQGSAFHVELPAAR